MKIINRSKKFLAIVIVLMMASITNSGLAIQDSAANQESSTWHLEPTWKQENDVLIAEGAGGAVYAAPCQEALSSIDFTLQQLSGNLQVILASKGQDQYAVEFSNNGSGKLGLSLLEVDPNAAFQLLRRQSLDYSLNSPLAAKILLQDMHIQVYLTQPGQNGPSTSPAIDYSNSEVLSQMAFQSMANSKTRISDINVVCDQAPQMNGDDEEQPPDLGPISYKRP